MVGVVGIGLEGGFLHREPRAWRAARRQAAAGRAGGTVTFWERPARILRCHERLPACDERSIVGRTRAGPSAAGGRVALALGLPALMVAALPLLPLLQERDGWALIVPPLLFPDGRLLSRRWAIVLVLGLAAAVGLALGAIVKPGLLDSGVYAIENPTGIPGLEGVARLLLDVSGIILLPCLPLAALAAALRFRRGSPIERQQLKWFGSPMALAALCLAGAATLPQPIGIACYVAMTVALGFVPVAIGIAILRYRLYEIDRLIGRTLVEAFANRARDQVDLDMLNAAVVGAVDEAVAPSRTGIWLRANT